MSETRVFYNEVGDQSFYCNRIELLLIFFFFMKYGFNVKYESNFIFRTIFASVLSSKNHNIS